MTSDERHILRGMVMAMATAQYNAEPMDKEAVASLLGMDLRPSKLTDELVATTLDDMMARLHGALLVSIPFAGTTDRQYTQRHPCCDPSGEARRATGR